MPDLKITQLTQDTTPTGADLVTTVKSPFGAGSNRKVLISDLANLNVVLQNTVLNSTVEWPNITQYADNFVIASIFDPGVSPTIALAGAPGNVDNGTYVYAYSFVSDSGNETLITGDSNSVTVVDNSVDGQIQVSGIPVSTNPNITQKGIYRNHDSEGYQLVAYILNSATSYLDNLDSGSIPGNPPPTSNQTGNLSASGDVIFSKSLFVSDDILGSGGNVEFSGSQNYYSLPSLDLRPHVGVETYGLKIGPVTAAGPDYSHDLVQLYKFKSSSQTLVLTVNDFGCLSLGTAPTGVSSFQVNTLLGSATYGIATAQGIKCLFNDYQEFGQASASITAGNFQFGQDPAQAMRLNVPNGTGFIFSHNGVDTVTMRGQSPMIIAQQVRAGGGAAKVLTATGAAHTSWNAVGGNEDIILNLARTVQFSVAQSEINAISILAPTYSYTSAQTTNDASTFTISGAPIAGTNATITRQWALWVKAGDVQLGADLWLTAGQYSSQYFNAPGNFTNPITDQAPVGVYGLMTNLDAHENAGDGSLGGLDIIGIGEQYGLRLNAFDVDDGTTGGPTMWLNSAKSDGAGGTNFVGDAEIAFRFSNNLDPQINIYGDGTLEFPHVLGDTIIRTGISGGDQRAFIFDIPVGAGGSSGQALEYQFKIDGGLQAGLLAQTNGTGGAIDFVWKIPSKSGDYGAAWINVPANLPSPVGLTDGCQVVLYNSNAGVLASRLYTFINSAWRFVNLT